eukprot:scaffold59342_cov22-Cyclotella_meneghiniana.AAC.1
MRDNKCTNKQQNHLNWGSGDETYLSNHVEKQQSAGKMKNGRFDAIRRPLMAGLWPRRDRSSARTAPASKMAVLSAPSVDYCDDLLRPGNVCKRNSSYDQRT